MGFFLREDLDHGLVSCLAPAPPRSVGRRSPKVVIPSVFTYLGHQLVQALQQLRSLLATVEAAHECISVWLLRILRCSELRDFANVDDKPHREVVLQPSASNKLQSFSRAPQCSTALHHLQRSRGNGYVIDVAGVPLRAVVSRSAVPMCGNDRHGGFVVADNIKVENTPEVFE